VKSPLGRAIGRAVVAAVAVLVAVFTVTTAGAHGRVPATNVWGGTWRPYPPTYHVGKPVALRIPMPDGVQLAGEAQYPTVRKTGLRAPGRFPVILELTPYPFIHDQKPSLFPKYGYIAVQVNERGTWESGGQRRNYAPQEGRDGAAVVRWLATHLPQSDGRVGMTGCSSPGKSQLLTAEYIGANSALKAIAPESAPQEGGTEDTLREAILVNGVPGPTSLLVGAGMVGLEGGSRPVPQYFEMAANWQSGGSWAYDRPSTYGSVRYPARKIVQNRIPALLWSGTKDIVPNGTMSMYAALQNAFRGRNWRLPMAPHQRPTGRYQVVMNDQLHCVHHDFTLLLRWYDTWVKGEHTGLGKTTTPIHFIEQPSGRWINAGRYPFTAHCRRLFLSPGHALSSGPAEHCRHALVHCLARVQARGTAAGSAQ